MTVSVTVPRLFAMLAVALLGILAAAPTASAHSGHEHALVDHEDPRQELPDSLITRAVAQAELSTLEPPSFASGSDPETWCGTETTANNTANAVVAAGTPHLKLVYAFASDQPNRFGTVKDRLQATVSLLNRYVASQSGGRKALRWDMGTSCGPQYVDIQVVALPGSRASYVPGGAPNFNTTRDAVSAAIGGIAAPRNLVIYADGLFGTNGTAGVASRYTTSDTATTQHDGGGLAAVVFGPQTLPTSAYAWPSVMFHEIGHNLGAVQDDSPHSTLAGHCFDESDVMCYADGGPDGQPSDITATCNALGGDMNETLDCGGDDYFNPLPAQGSYLDEHWNLYGVAHLGPCSAELANRCGLAGAALDGTRPTNTTLVPALSYRRNWTPTISGTDSESAVDRSQWRLNSGAIQHTATANVTGADLVQHNLYTRVRDSAGNWSTWRRDPVFLDTTAPAVTVTCPAAWSTAASPAPQCTYSVTDASGNLASVETQKGSDAIVAGGSGGTLNATADAQVIRVRATDAAGNTSGWSQDTARWDRVNPVASVTCPSAWGAASTTCHVDASDAGSGIQAVTRRVGAGSITTVAAGSDFVVSTAGAQTITVQATDAAGRTQTATATSRVDGTPPAVTLSCPSGWSASGSCSVTASDPESGVTSRLAAIDGGLEIDATGGVTTAASGDHAVVARAVNGAGAATTTAAQRLKIDRSDPAMALTCPAGWQDTAFACTASGTDAHSGVATVEYRVDGGSATSVAAASAAIAISAEGIHTVEARTVDAVGRTSAWHQLDAKLDLTAPTATLGCPTAWQAEQAACTVASADARSGVATVTWRLDSDPQQRALPLAVLAHGTHDIALTVIDNAGNAKTDSATVKVDDTAPVVGVSCPSGWQPSRFDCTASVADPDSAIASKSVRLDNGAPAPLTGTAVSIATDGAHSVVVVATNGAGQSATSSAAAASLDERDPVAGVSCEDGWQADSVSCAVTGSDAHSGVDSVTWKVGDSAPQAVVSGTSVEVGAPGAHTMTATTTDNVGHTRSVTDLAQVDTTAPTASVSCPTGWRTSASCTVTAADDHSGVAVRRARLQGDGQPFPFSGASVDVTGEGEHQVQVQVDDAVGRSSTWSTPSAVKIDATDPVAMVTCENGWQGDPVACTVTGSDGRSGLQTLTWKVGGGTPQTVASGTTVHMTSPGEHTVTATATDVAGRTATATDTAALDATAPSADVNCQDGWKAAQVTCTVTGSDGGSGLGSLTWTTGDGATHTVGSGDTITVDTHGEHTITAVATDNVSMQTAGSDTARVDTTAPTGVAVSCPDAWQATGSCTVAATDPESGVATRRAKVGSDDAADLADGTVSVTTGGVRDVIGQAVNAAGRESAWSAPATVKVDDATPIVSLSCTVIGDGRHSCTPQASDAQSGLASLRLQHDGVTETGTRAQGTAFEVSGPATVAMTATDLVGRTATSAPLTLSGPAAATEPPPPLPAPPSPLVPSTPPTPLTPQTVILPLTARGVAKLPGSGSGVLEVTSPGGERRAALTLRPGRLKPGIYRLKLCIIGGECRAKQVKLRRAGRPAAMRAQVPAPAGVVRATFTIAKKSGRTFKQVATASTSVQLG